MLHICVCLCGNILSVPLRNHDFLLIILLVATREYFGERERKREREKRAGVGASRIQLCPVLMGEGGYLGPRVVRTWPRYREINVRLNYRPWPRRAALPLPRPHRFLTPPHARGSFLRESSLIVDAATSSKEAIRYG